MFHLAGIPTYIVIAEIATNRVLSRRPAQARLPALREAAPIQWRDSTRATLTYARAAHAARGHLADTAGAIGTAACQGAHAVLAGRGEWVTNEKSLIDRAGLRSIGKILTGLTPVPGHLLTAVDTAAELLCVSRD